ncbi:MAG TPA: hypothetical protein VJU59_23640 [Paraburkholderia sp.]|uniref:hypothetical protein n=1 Tax=Paraburkholderia sp. TaxID=1926495 RepID=UPI002B4A1955|nr:hypothetical protein [Paraburkholderia sp.]HKR42629.1 hypothetical protein [Paraburkholderia sp.]
MRIVDVELMRPTGTDVLIAAVIATAVAAVLAIINRSFDLHMPRVVAVMFVCTSLWGSLSEAFGISKRGGPRHAALNIAVCAVIVGAGAPASHLAG